jgi:hypothetical protein
MPTMTLSELASLCQKQSKEIATLKAELEASRDTFLAEHDENVRLHTELERQRAENERFISTFKKMVFLGTKGTSIIWPDKTLAELVNLANQALQSAAKQEMSPKAQSIDISQERVADDDKQDETK